MPVKSIDRVTWVGLIIFMAYCLGILFPDVWWTTHFIAFFPPVVKYGILVIAAVLLFFPVKLPLNMDLSSNLVIGGIALLSGVLMAKFSIVFDHYGDAYKFDEFLEQIPTEIPQKAQEALFSFKIGTSAGQDSVLGIVTYIAYYGKMTYQAAFGWLDAICGGMFVFSWLFFLKYYFRKNTSRILFLFVLFTAPLLLNFLGHVEIYAPVYLSYSLWLILLLMYYRNKSSRNLFLLAVVWLLCLKLHSAAILLLPALILTLLGYFYPKANWIKKLFTRKGLGYFIFLPAIIVGLVVYFIVLEDYKDPRALEKMVFGIDRLFLPLLSPEPPLNNYNLLGWNHLFDFVILPFLWSPLVLMMFFSMKRKDWKQLRANEPVFLLVGMSFIFFVMLFFAINPLLSMPIDWDLFCFPVLILIALLAIVVHQLESTENPIVERWYTGMNPIIVLSLPFFIIHFSGDMLAKRYEFLGKRIFHSYYEWSSKIIEYSLENGYKNSKEQFIQRDRIISELEPYALEGRDWEYLELLLKQSKYLLREEQNAEKALSYLQKAQKYNSKSKLIVLYEMESYFLLESFDKALEKAERLVQLNYPSKEKALSVVIHCAVEARKYEKATRYSEEYLKEWKNPVIEEVLLRLQKGYNLENLGQLFRQISSENQK